MSKDLFPTKRKIPRDPFEKHMLKNLGKIYEEKKFKKKWR